MPVIRVCKSCGQKNRVPARHLSDTGHCGNCKSTIPPVAEPLQADPALFDEVSSEARVPVLVDFWAEWCEPCKMAAPEVARTAADMAGHAVVLQVDAERHPELAARYRIQAIPYFLVLYGGRSVVQQAGVVGHEEMEKWLRSGASSAA